MWPQSVELLQATAQRTLGSSLRAWKSSQDLEILQGLALSSLAWPTRWILIIPDYWSTPLRCSNFFSWNWMIQSFLTKSSPSRTNFRLEMGLYCSADFCATQCSSSTELGNCTFESATFVSWHCFVQKMSYISIVVNSKYKCILLSTICTFIIYVLAHAIMEYFSLRSLLLLFFKVEVSILSFSKFWKSLKCLSKLLAWKKRQ